MGDDTTFEEETKERYGWGDPRHRLDEADASLVPSSFQYECPTCNKGEQRCNCSGNLLSCFDSLASTTTIEPSDRALQQTIFDRLPLSPMQRRDVITSLLREQQAKTSGSSSQINHPKRKRARA